ncbi:hypothetical protein PanWU01x14_020800 [Parasponia andersonii]|uniref:Tyrosine-protein kinase n=1 Tax=Parasponia andersonii TaxID=3476 RepID=A0A2P5DYS7_PARAD|nr:hypothetical protein PanWU01x14_020800 [Parasponia andersonii]
MNLKQAQAELRNSWKERTNIELLNPALAETCSTDELTRYVQVVILCAQESVADRPTLLDAVSMLGSDKGILPNPRQPAFSTPVGVNGTRQSSILLSP